MLAIDILLGDEIGPREAILDLGDLDRAAAVDHAGKLRLDGGPLEGFVVSLFERLWPRPLPGKLHLEAVADAGGVVALGAARERGFKRPAEGERLAIHCVGADAERPPRRAEKERHRGLVPLRQIRGPLRPLVPGAGGAEVRFLDIIEEIERPAAGLAFAAAPFRLTDPGEVPAAAGKGPAGIFMQLDGKPELLEIRAAGGFPSRLAGALHGGESHLQKEPDDADDDQQFDEGESAGPAGAAANSRQERRHGSALTSLLLMLPGGGELAGELPFFELGLERRSLLPRQPIPPAEGVGHSLIPSNHPDRRHEADGEEHRDESQIDNKPGRPRPVPNIDQVEERRADRGEELERERHRRRHEGDLEPRHLREHRLHRLPGLSSGRLAWIAIPRHCPRGDPFSPAAPTQRNRSANALRFTCISPAPARCRPSRGGAMGHRGRDRQFIEKTEDSPHVKTLTRPPPP